MRALAALKHSLLVVSMITVLSLDGLAQVIPGGTVFGSPMVLVQGSWPNLVSLGLVKVNDPLAELAFKKGSTLAVKIDGDRQLLLFDVDRADATLRVHHTYGAWLAGPRYHVVNVGFFNSGSSYLIDARDGSVYDVGHAPLLSPSSDKAIIWTQDFMNGPIGPAFIDFRDRPLKFAVPHPVPACNGQTPAYLRPTATWLDDFRVEFTGSYPDLPAERSAGKQLLRFVDGKPEWEC